MKWFEIQNQQVTPSDSITLFISLHNTMSGYNTKKYVEYYNVIKLYSDVLKNRFTDYIVFNINNSNSNIISCL